MDKRSSPVWFLCKPVSLHNSWRRQEGQDKHHLYGGIPLNKHRRIASGLQSQQIVRDMKAVANYINMSTLFQMVRISVIWNGLNYNGGRVYIQTDGFSGEVTFLNHHTEARTILTKL
jgi:hypothetical protein